MRHDGSTGGFWRSYTGPVVLSARRRRLNLVLLAVWTVAGLAAVFGHRYDLLWLPVAGIVTCSVLALRDRSGRRRSTQ